MAITKLALIFPLAFTTALLVTTAGCSGGGSKPNIGSNALADKSGDAGHGKKHKGHGGAQGHNVDGDEDGGDDDQGDDKDDDGDD